VRCRWRDKQVDKHKVADLPTSKRPRPSSFLPPSLVDPPYPQTLLSNMADAANRSQRAAALEEKRRKLEDMKKKRALRDQGSSAAAAANRTAASANLDDYIDGLLDQPSAAGSAAAVPGTATQTGTDETAAADNNNNSAAAPTPSGSAGAASPVAPATTEVRPPAPPPKSAVESFTAGTQTEEEDFVEQPALVEPEEEEPEAASETPEAPAPSAATESRAPSLLTPDQVAQEVTRTDFGSFLTTASKKVERLLGNAEWTSSLLVDSLGDDQPSSEKDANASEAAAADRWIPSRQVYEAGKWTATRDVTDVSWSTHHRDVFLATYHAPRGPYSAPSPVPVAAAAASSSSMMTPRSGELQADGLALLWNLSMPTRPEHVLTCASPVLKGRLVPQQPHLVLGGCASGQVVVWDVRSGGRYPVQTSALTTLSPTVKQQQQGHVHPICGMEVTDGGVSYSFEECWTRRLVAACTTPRPFSHSFCMYNRRAS
jgi:dynein intermediate chain